MTELLSPAGNLEKLKVSIDYGADAVYIGGKNYSLRANAANFSLEEMREGVEYAHQFNKKVYVTINIIFHEKDLIGLEDYLKYLDSINVDGVIVSDIYVINLIKTLKLDLNIVLSTQTSTLNKQASLFFKDLGVKRIVLAREALKDDILSVIETGLETEVFIHGAMCTSFSGKCVMSNYVTNRDSNRGGCAQICRFMFDTMDEKNPKFTMMSKDLNMLKHIEDLIKIGVTSFKIEGRMRSVYYLATVNHTYRQIIDKIHNNELTNGFLKYANDILNRVANRESIPQFYDKIAGSEEQYFQDRNEVSNQDFLGQVLGYENNMIKLEIRNYFKLGDVIELFGPKIEEMSLEITEMYNDKNELIEIANHPKDIIYIPFNTVVYEGDMIRVKVFDKKEYI